jgi:hypothetical protein
MKLKKEHFKNENELDIIVQPGQRVIVLVKIIGTTKLYSYEYRIQQIWT